MQRGGGGKQKEIVFLFLPLEKIRKIHSLLPPLTNSVTNWPTPLCGSHFLTEIIYDPAAAAPNYTQTIWLKMLHTWQKVCPFLKIPTVNSPGASPRVLTQMHLTTGRKQTGTANFMGQLWREVHKYVEQSEKKKMSGKFSWCRHVPWNSHFVLVDSQACNHGFALITGQLPRGWTQIPTPVICSIW